MDVPTREMKPRSLRLIDSIISKNAARAIVFFDESETAIISVMENAQAHVIFRGRVQGVNFRAFAARVAGSLGLEGWVKNLPDGSVEAVFEGQKSLVEEAIKRCRTGPSFADVEDTKIEWRPYEGGTGGFSIRY